MSLPYPKTNKQSLETIHMENWQRIRSKRDKCDSNYVFIFSISG